MEHPYTPTPRPTLKALLAAYERRIIQEALHETRGNQRRAARALGVLPTTLHEKMKRLGILNRPAPSREEGSAASVFLVA
jgi:two-component system response regulator HydG